MLKDKSFNLLQRESIFIKYSVTVQAYERKTASGAGYVLLVEPHVQKEFLKDVPTL